MVQEKARTSGIRFPFVFDRADDVVRLKEERPGEAPSRLLRFWARPVAHFDNLRVLSAI